MTKGKVPLGWNQGILRALSDYNTPDPPSRSPKSRIMRGREK
jgi:hypothetical protein